MDEIEEKIVDTVLSILRNEDWFKLVFEIQYQSGGGKSAHYQFFVEEEKSQPLSRAIRKDIGSLVDSFYEDRKQDPKERFNHVIFTIHPNKAYEADIFWDNAEVQKQLIDRERLFPQWINNQMITLIYKNEFPNGPTETDDDGDPMYVSTWDEGIFTFNIGKDKEIALDIELIKDEVSRNMELSLPDYFITAMLEHYELTNGNLIDSFKAWNNLVIKSPHNDLPYGRFDEHVFYSLD